MQKFEKCTRCRLGLIAFALFSWIISIGADLALWARFGLLDWGLIGHVAVVIGMVSMGLAVAFCAYSVHWESESPATKADLLDIGVMLAAICLFALNLVVRNSSSFADSALPLLLSVVGVGSVLLEFYVDLADAEWTFTHRQRSV